MTMTESFDGCRLNVQSEGPSDAPVVMLSHHLGGSLQVWDVLAEALRNRVRIVRYDTRGQGSSEASDGPYSIEMLGRDALAVMAALNLQRVDFIGLSQGGMTGMWLAANHPEKIQRLVLANTTPFIPNKPIWDELIAKAQSQGMDDIAVSTLEGWLSPGFKVRDPAGVQALIETMRHMSPKGYAGNCAVLRDVDLRNRLSDIVCSTLVIGGAEDGSRGAAGPVMASGVRDGKLVIIERAAHLSAVENAQDFNRAIEEFLT